MSEDDAIRRKAQEDNRNNSGAQHLTNNQGSYQQVQTYNNELDRIRREEDERRRRQG